MLLRTVETMMIFLSCPWNSSTDPTWWGETGLQTNSISIVMNEWMQPHLCTVGNRSIDFKIILEFLSLIQSNESTLSSGSSLHRFRADFRAFLIFSTCEKRKHCYLACHIDTDKFTFKNTNHHHAHSPVFYRGWLCQYLFLRVWGYPSSLVFQWAWSDSRPELQSRTRWKKTDCWPPSHLSPSPRERSAGNPVMTQQRAVVSYTPYHSGLHYIVDLSILFTQCPIEFVWFNLLWNSSFFTVLSVKK